MCDVLPVHFITFAFYVQVSSGVHRTLLKSATGLPTPMQWRTIAVVRILGLMAYTITARRRRNDGQPAGRDSLESYDGCGMSKRFLFVRRRRWARKTRHRRQHTDCTDALVVVS